MCHRSNAVLTTRKIRSYRTTRSEVSYSCFLKKKKGGGFNIETEKKKKTKTSSSREGRTRVKVLPVVRAVYLKRLVLVYRRRWRAGRGSGSRRLFVVDRAVVHRAVVHVRVFHVAAAFRVTASRRRFVWLKIIDTQHTLLHGNDRRSYRVFAGPVSGACVRVGTNRYGVDGGRWCGGFVCRVRPARWGRPLLP
jgi:hypothetical protein